MPWQQVSLRVPERSAAQVEELLSELGAVSVTLQDGEDEAVFQIELGSTPIWSNTEVVGLFPFDTDTTALIAAIKTRAELEQAPTIMLEEVADTDWERVCMQDFKPMRFGKRIWICPSWETPPQPEAVNIMLDPGLAFGTGTHPTTALCLEWLDQQDLHGKSVIDYGCGSGILAIAAALLGADTVTGIDNDPQAILASESNRALNGLQPEQMHVFLPGASELSKADVLVANILAGPLEELTSIIAALVKPGGKLVLSGVLSQQTSALMAAYSHHFTMLSPVIRDEWVLVEGTRH
jgi:ribosomal protein L11 methyltransferase